MNAKAPLAHCEDCLLRNRTFVPPSFSQTDGPVLMAVVGEGPGRTEVIKGAPFVGPSGSLLWPALNAAGIKREKIHVTNAVLCFTGTEGVPPAAIECCKDRLMAELAECGAKYILSLGKEARKVFTDEDLPISTTRGCWVFVETEGGGKWWILPSIHPAYVLRPPNSDEQGLGGPSSAGPAFLFDIEKFARTNPRLFVPTKTRFWHYPDSKMRKWLEPDLKHHHDDAERKWLRTYCIENDIDWIEADSLPDNKAALREAAKRMVTEIINELAWLAQGSHFNVIAIDLETTGYLPHKDRILNLSMSWDVGQAMVISGGLLWQKDVKSALRRLFETEGITWVGHNGKFDMKFLLAQLGTAPTLDHDTFILHCALDERSQLMLHALKPLVSQYFDVADYEAKTIKQYLPSKKTSFANVPPPILAHYAGMDTDYTRRLWFELMAELEHEPGTKRLYTDLLMPAVRAFIPIELRGVQIDWTRLTEVLQFLEGKEWRVLERIRELTGDVMFNPNSHVQVKRVLWDEKGYTPPRIRGKTSRSTKKEVLKILADQYPKDEFLSLITDIRRYRKLMSSYVKNLYRFEDDQGRVHPVFNVTGTEVGRLSARDPAIQTIPRAYEPTGKLIRDFYVASPGYVLVHADYSQAELRCAAVLAQDEFLLEVYRNDRDLHSEVALSMYGEGYTKEQRNICKMFNFAYLYGGTQHSFAYDAGMKIKKATAWVKRYNVLMNGLATWRGTQFQILQAQGYVESPTGRRRRFPLLLDSNAADAKKAVVHAPCAGTASDMTLAGLVDAQRTAPEDVFPLIMVHDSNIAECPDGDERIAETAQALKRLMELAAKDVFDEAIPFKVDVEVGYRWGSLQPYDGTPAWRDKVEGRSLFKQTEFLARMEHEICEACGRWNPPRETRRGPSASKCLTCEEEL